MLAIAIAWPRLTWSETLPSALPLFVAASIFRWSRGRGWGELGGGGGLRIAIGAIVGAAALGLAIAIGTPVVEALSNRAVEWSQYGMVRGNATQLAVFVIYVALAAVVAELALRGWIVERVLELSPGPPVLPILVGGIAEALLVPGGAGARIGAAIFGLGLGWFYVAGGRSIVAPLVARVVFCVGALLLEGFKIVG